MNNIELYSHELEKIRIKHGGVLNPHTVVDVAQNPKNVLHNYFQWDDMKAAQEYRIWQARQLISVMVTILPNETRTVRAYVSLKDDRGEKGGYRQIIDVLSDDDMRKQLLTEAFAEFNHFRQKYQQLKVLAPVFSAMEIVEEKEEVLQLV